MRVHKTAKISALLDGELTGLRRWLVERHLGRCPVCAAEYRHLEHVRQMLAENRPAPRMSDSLDFFWSKVKREIQAREGQTAKMPVPHLSVPDWLGGHRLALVSATVALVAGLGVVWSVQTRPQPAGTVIERVATSIPDTVATPLKPDDSDVAVIWVSGLPWTPNLTAHQTEFADLDT